MANGYTYPIIEGEGITFSQFAQRCARSFGACFTLRDEPLSNELPDKLPYDDYYKERLEHYQQEYNKFLENPTTYEEAERKYAEYLETMKTCYEHDKMVCTQNREKYKAMLDQVEAWQPPSVEHEPLKQFMIEQLNETIKFEKEIPLHFAKKEEFIKDEMSGEYIKFHRDYYAEKLEEYNRVHAQRNEWIRLLKESLI